MERDLIVVGGGPVALTAGLALARAVRGLSLAVLAHARPRPRAAAASFDARVYALSPGNVAFLGELGVWQALPPERIVPVHAMEIYGDGASRLKFDAYQAGVPALAWIVEDGLLQDALRAGLAADVVAPAECDRLSIDAEKAVVDLKDGARVTGRLVIGADGATSFVRRAAGIEAVEKDYGQCAIVANFECEKRHANTAYQWFLGGPVLALLPLPGNRISIVWSLPDARAERLDDGNLAAEVQAACGSALGEMRLLTPSRRYPLRRLSARRVVAPRVVLAGDAAHVVHPLAGQGLNLGLQDVRVLARVLAEREPMRDLGDLRLLRRYERARAEPILAMDAVIGGLFALFGAEGRIASLLRNNGLNLTDRLPVLKNVLIRQAMT